MKRIIAGILMLCGFTRAWAMSETVTDGQEVSVGVDSTTGVTIQLPTFVRVVTPAQKFHLQPILMPVPVDPANPSQLQTPGDVRAFIVKGQGEERITFMLADDKTVTVRFYSSQGADNFVGLRYRKKTPRRVSDTGFLAPERDLILAMLRDEQTAGRQVVSLPVEIPQYPDLKATIVRQFKADGLEGYAFTVTNTSSKTLRINPTVLAIGTPNRAILTHIDHEILKPCSEDNSADPRGTGCMTGLRVVTRGGETVLPRITGTRANMPFVTVVEEPR